MPLLDDFKNCFVGQTQIKQIYAGTQKVWPKAAPPVTPRPFDLFYFNFEDSVAGVCPWLPYSNCLGYQGQPGGIYLQPHNFLDGRLGGKCLEFPYDGGREGLGSLQCLYRGNNKSWGWLEINGEPVAGPPNAENTAHLCPPIGNIKLHEGYSSKVKIVPGPETSDVWLWENDADGVPYWQRFPTNSLTPESSYGYSPYLGQSFFECWLKTAPSGRPGPEADLNKGQADATLALSNAYIYIYILEKFGGLDNVLQISLALPVPGSAPLYKTHILSLPSDPWIHFSFGFELTSSNGINDYTYDFFYSVNGELFTESHRVNSAGGLGEGFGSNVQIGIGKQFHPDHNGTFKVAEFRTASKPMYREDFIPR